MCWRNHAISIVDEMMKYVLTPWWSLLKLDIVGNVFFSSLLWKEDSSTSETSESVYPSVFYFIICIL